MTNEELKMFCNSFSHLVITNTFSSASVSVPSCVYSENHMCVDHFPLIHKGVSVSCQQPIHRQTVFHLDGNTSHLCMSLYLRKVGRVLLLLLYNTLISRKSFESMYGDNVIIKQVLHY